MEKKNYSDNGKRDWTETRKKTRTLTIRSYEQVNSISLRAYNVYNFLQTF